MRRTWWQWLGVTGAVLLMGAGPVPATPKVKVGTVCEVHVKVRITGKVRLHLPGGPKTMPSPARIDLTRRLEVLAVSGGAITRLRVAYVSVVADGPGTDEDQSLAGRTFVVGLGRTAAGPPVVTEHGKPLQGRLAHKVWDDQVDVMAPTRVTAFVKKVLAQPGRALPVPQAIYAELAGETEDAPTLLSGSMTLVGVSQGRATTRLVARERQDDGLKMTVDNDTTTQRDAATGRALRVDATSTVHGQGMMSLPVGPVKAELDAKATMTEVFTWSPAAAR